MPGAPGVQEGRTGRSNPETGHRPQARPRDWALGLGLDSSASGPAVAGGSPRASTFQQPRCPDCLARAAGRQPVIASREPGTCLVTVSPPSALGIDGFSVWLQRGGRGLSREEFRDVRRTPN